MKAWGPEFTPFLRASFKKKKIAALRRERRQTSVVRWPSNFACACLCKTAGEGRSDRSPRQSPALVRQVPPLLLAPPPHTHTLAPCWQPPLFANTLSSCLRPAWLQAQGKATTQGRIECPWLPRPLHTPECPCCGYEVPPGGGRAQRVCLSVA